MIAISQCAKDNSKLYEIISSLVAKNDIDINLQNEEKIIYFLY